jgi:hypothetical protein
MCALNELNDDGEARFAGEKFEAADQTASESGRPSGDPRTLDPRSSAPSDARHVSKVGRPLPPQPLSPVPVEWRPSTPFALTLRWEPCSSSS